MKFLNLIFVLSLGLNLNAQTWSQSVPLPSNAEGRNHPITFSIGDTGYVVTGYSVVNQQGIYMNDFYKFDGKTKTWTKGTDFPGRARGFGYGVSHKGKAYIGFGLAPNLPLNDLWEYDPKSGRWKQLANFPGTPRWHPAMVAADNKIFIGIGSSGGGDLGDWWEYDITSNTWTQKMNFPGGRRHHPYYFGIGSDVYAGLGHSGSPRAIYSDFYKYDYKTNTWTQVASLPAQGRVAGTQFSYNGKGYVLSGQGASPFHTNLPTGEFWEYNPDSNAWTSLNAHPGEGRWAPGSFVIDNMVYFLCGRSNSAEEKDMFSFTLPKKEPEEPKEPVSIQDDVSFSKENLFTVYPNPTSNLLHVNIQRDELQELHILDITGKKHDIQISESSENQFVLSLENLENGIYILSLRLKSSEVENLKIFKN